MMVGIGPFITIPLLIASMGGPQSMLGWFLGAAVALADGMVWSELAAQFPGSGGTYHFYHAAFGETRAGRLLKFVFVWQFLFSGPLEMATGAIGLVKYLGYFYPGLAGTAWNWGDGRSVSRRPRSRGDSWRRSASWPWSRSSPIGGSAWPAGLMVVLWVGMLITVAWVIVTGFLHFDAARAFDFPPGRGGGAD